MPTASGKARRDKRTLDEVLAELEKERARRRAAEQKLGALNDPLLLQVAEEYAAFATDAEGVITYVSTSSERVTGRPAEEVIGQNWRQFLFPGTRTYATAEIDEQQMLTSGPTPVRLFEARHADGSRRLLEVQSRPMTDSDGAVVGIQGVYRDVTHIQHTEAELRIARDALDSRMRARTSELERRIQFEQLIVELSTRFINLPIERLHDGMADALRQIGKFTDVGRSYFYTLDDPDGTAELVCTWSADDAPPVHDAVYRISRDDAPWMRDMLVAGHAVHAPTLSDLPGEAVVERRWLAPLDVKSFVNVPLLSSGRMRGFLGLVSFREHKSWSPEDIALLRVVGEIFVNAMDREKTQRALQQSEERLRLTFEGVEGGLYDWNLQTDEVIVSDFWLRSMGLPPGENLRSGEERRGRVHPDDWTTAVAHLHRHFAGVTPVYEAEYRVRRADGAYSWNFDRGRVILRDEAGKPLRMVGVDRDISDVIEAKEARQRLETQLAHLARVATMGETTAGIAHEVNQPLHAASTFSAAARRAVASGNAAKADELIGKAAEQIARAGEIIRRMCEFTRPRPTEFAPVDLNALVRRSAEFAANYNRAARVRFEYDLDEALPPAQGDAVQLQQVIVNLMQNGIDAVVEAEREDPTIWVSTRRESGSAVLVVSDNGVGPKHQNDEEMFEAFVSTKPGGMGIGLSLCRTIVASHEGAIEASRGPHGGMSFTVRLPVRRGRADG